MSEVVVGYQIRSYPVEVGADAETVYLACKLTRPDGLSGLFHRLFRLKPWCKILCSTTSLTHAMHVIDNHTMGQDPAIQILLGKLVKSFTPNGTEVE